MTGEGKMKEASTSGRLGERDIVFEVVVCNMQITSSLGGLPRDILVVSNQHE